MLEKLFNQTTYRLFNRSDYSVNIQFIWTGIFSEIICKKKLPWNAKTFFIHISCIWITVFVRLARCSKFQSNLNIDRDNLDNWSSSIAILNTELNKLLGRVTNVNPVMYYENTYFAWNFETGKTVSNLNLDLSAPVDLVNRLNFSTKITELSSYSRFI